MEIVKTIVGARDKGRSLCVGCMGPLVDYKEKQLITKDLIKERVPITCDYCGKKIQ